MNKADIDWEGASGQRYRYWIHDFDANPPAEPGNYIFAKETVPGSGRWIPIYVGETENLAERLADHEKANCATRNGVTHLHLHVSSAPPSRRRAEEADLIKGWSPPCNLKRR